MSKRIKKRIRTLLQHGNVTHPLAKSDSYKFVLTDRGQAERKIKSPANNFKKILDFEIKKVS